MASERQIAANRRNALKSTGPRTTAGKLRASANALRHGLAASPLRQHALFPEIKVMAKAIFGDCTDPLLLQPAMLFAECQHLLNRSRALQVTITEGPRAPPTNPFNGSPNYDSGAMPFSTRDPSPDNEDDTMRAVLRIARYEQRAWSRRKRTFGTFVQALENRQNEPKVES
jgi:hypothetical protein